MPEVVTKIIPLDRQPQVHTSHKWGFLAIVVTLIGMSCKLLNINLKAEVTRKETAGLKSEMLEIKDKLMDIQQNIGKFKAHEGEDE